LQANDYKERSYPVWNLLKELDAQGKLTPLQKVLTAPTMPAEELYDEVADPYETKNLTGSPEHQKVLVELRGVLDRWIEESNDQGKTLEPVEVAAAKGATKPLPPGGEKKAKKQKAAKKAKTETRP
jgi:N-sulfoglucosamine sulfohydrolase